MSNIVLGIDLGTTNSAVSYVVGGKPVIIENSEGGRTTPSVVFYNTKNQTLTTGDVAKRSAVLNSKTTISKSKGFIGRSFNDPEVTEDKKRASFDVINDGGKVKFKMDDKTSFSPEEIGATILRKIKADSETKLGQKISEAVITVPAYFNDAQRQATKDAGEIAGLKVLRIINEPTAAALAYGFDKNKEEKILVYDLGGGTFDVTVLDISAETIEVLATAGDTHLGGEDFDHALIDYIISEFKKDSGIDLSNDKPAKQRIKEAAEKCKHDLSTQNEHQINLPFISMGADGQHQHLVMSITRAKLEELVRPLVEKTMEPVQKALKDAGLKKEQINEIIMVGGMTRMPLVQKVTEEFFGKKPNLSVNPDEVVALGAAIQGAVLKGDVKDILLLDVTPLTLAIETAGGIATPMIHRNTTVPTSKSQIFSTYSDGQTAVDIHIVQGERPLAVDNKSLGKFSLTGIPTAPRGVPQIEVSFDIDANGILHVTAKDKATNKESQLRVEGSNNLSKDDIEKMKDDAAKYEQADQLKKAKIDKKNEAESAVFQAEKNIKDIGDKIGQEDLKNINEAKDNLEKLVKDDNSTVETLEEGIKKLQEVMMKAGEKIYTTSTANPQENNESSESSTSEKEDKKEEVEDVQDISASK
jgi:molecular chaperone DnaK